MKTPKSATLLRPPNRRSSGPFVVEPRILIIRHERIILDADLAQLYGVPVKRLNEQVKRNRKRFPCDFMFRLTLKEHSALRSQIATSNSRGGRRYAPFAFTEHGAIMAATVLNSERAVQMSVFVVRAFVRLRNLLGTNRKLAAKICELEDRLDSHDTVILDLVKAMRELMDPPRRRIGFQLPAGVNKERRAVPQLRHG
ncbi:MAG TPA: ORF6N domain-containing protein [Candidatus Binatia bacterium]|nr:ORF6N domain-containing protein [Candidatus Binatia bacterium]